MVILIIVLFQIIPYSPTKNKFSKDVEKFLENRSIESKILKEEDIVNFPEPLKRYLRMSGYIGKNLSKNMRIDFKDVDFFMDKKKPGMKKIILSLTILKVLIDWLL